MKNKQRTVINTSRGLGTSKPRAPRGSLSARPRRGRIVEKKETESMMTVETEMFENERKYVLWMEDSKTELKTWQKSNTCWEIIQGYLNEKTRIRSKSHDSISQFTFTYKNLVPSTKVLIEVEKEIDAGAFAGLWESCNQFLTKTRVDYFYEGVKWEIDFFKNLQSRKREIYLVMAEVELPAGQDAPTVIPPYIAEHLIFEVPRGDARFNNIELCRPLSTKKLVDKLRKEKLKQDWIKQNGTTLQPKEAD